MPTDKPILVIMRGLPGGGKSTLAKAVASLLPGDKCVVLDPDAVDIKGQEFLTFAGELAEQGVDQKLHQYRYLRSKAYEAIKQSKIIIWNQAFTNQDILDRTIKNLQAYAADEADVALAALVVEVEVDPMIARSRIADRVAAGGHKVSDEAFERFINDYATFSDYGYPTMQVSGESDLTESAKSIHSRLMQLV